jgi:hypothetical protein
MKNNHEYRLVIDFDNTIAYSEYPNIKGLKPNVVEVMQRLHNEGFIILINTCRSCPYEQEVYDFLEENKIPFDWFNCNDPKLIILYGNDCRKISGDLYIDDKNLGGIPDDWEEIYTLIHKDIEQIENEE